MFLNIKCSFKYIPTNESMSRRARHDSTILHQSLSPSHSFSRLARQFFPVVLQSHLYVSACVSSTPRLHESKAKWLRPSTVRPLDAAASSGCCHRGCRASYNSSFFFCSLVSYTKERSRRYTYTRSRIYTVIIIYTLKFIGIVTGIPLMSLWVVITFAFFGFLVFSFFFYIT